jgi:very-short-patch-repair endonuclease
VTKSQLMDLGISEVAIKARAAVGEFERAAPGAFIVNGSPRTVFQACAVALLSRKKAVLSGRTAGWLHSFDGVAAPTRPEVTVPSTASGRSPVAVVRRSQHFRHIGVRQVHGLPTASPVETIFRMAEYVNVRLLVRMIDGVLLADSLCIDDLGEVYLRHQGERLRGMAKLRPVLLERLEDGSAPPTESALEALAAEVMGDVELPPLVRQAPIPWAPASGRVDLLIPDWRLIIELDGRRWHARTENFESDRRRDNAAVAAGYSVLRFTWKMLTLEPDRCMNLILEAGSRVRCA